MFGRRLRQSVAVLVAAGATLTGIASSAYADDPPPVEPQVIGGNPPTQNYPAGSYVSLKYDAPTFGRSNWHTCGAALTFNNLIRTAAHCVTNPPPEMSDAQKERLARSYHMDTQSVIIPVEAKSFWVRVGSKNKETGGVIARATITWVHPNWIWATTPGSEVDDVALLSLDQFVDVYTLPLAPRPARPGDTVYRLGWGVTLPDGNGPLPSQIRELKSQIIDPVNCAPGEPFGITTRDVCVNNPNGVDGDCFGDSGGPIVIKMGGVFYDAGIDSRGVGEFCGVTPSSYTSTPEFRTEIYDVARGAPAATAPATRKADDLGLPYEPGADPVSQPILCRSQANCAQQAQGIYSLAG
jgi:hypothetical protein